MAVFDGKLRVGIDWENVGLVSYHTSPSTSPNLWRDPLYHSDTFMDTAFLHTVNIPSDQLILNTGIILLQLTSSIALGAYYIGSNGANKNVTINPSTEYTLSVWLSSTDNGIHTVGMEFFQTSTGTWVSADSDTFSTTNFTKITLNAISPSTATHVRIFVQRPNNTNSDVIIISGIFLTATTLVNHPIYYNSGNSNYHTTTYGYEDITDRTISFDTTLGKSDWVDRFPNDGELKLVLRNDDKRFSPDYSGSPLYGFIKPNRRIFVQLDNDTNGLSSPLWSGWVKNIVVKPNIYGERTVTITANSGINKLNTLPVKPYISGFVTGSVDMITVAKRIVREGWDIPYLSGVFKLGISKINGGVLYDPSLVVLDTSSSGTLGFFKLGVSLLGYGILVDPGLVGINGYDWKGEFADTLLSELADTFGGYITQTRAGQIIIVTKSAIDNATSVAMNYTDFLAGNDLNYGGDIYTAIELNNPVVEFLDGTGSLNNAVPVAKDRTIVSIGANQIVFHTNTYDADTLSDKTLVLRPSVLHSNIRTIKSSDNTAITNLNSTGYTPEEFIYTRDTDLYDIGDHWATGSITIINNINNFDVTYNYTLMTIVGRLNVPFIATGKYIFGDTLTYGIITKNLENRFVNTTSLINQYINLKVSRAQIKKWFSDLSFIVEDIGTLTRLTQKEQFSVIKISEDQSGISNLDQVIIGEKMHFTPQYLEKSWILGPKV